MTSINWHRYFFSPGLQLPCLALYLYTFMLHKCYIYIRKYIRLYHHSICIQFPSSSGIHRYKTRRWQRRCLVYFYFKFSKGCTHALFNNNITSIYITCRPTLITCCFCHISYNKHRAATIPWNSRTPHELLIPDGT